MHKGPEQHYTVRFDPDSGVLRATHSAYLSAEIYAQYRDEFARGIADARLTTPVLRILIDGREMEEMPPAERIAELSKSFIPEDRIALIVRSSLLKMEARRVAHSPALQTFLSENAAWTWLLAYDTPNVSAA